MKLEEYRESVRETTRCSRCRAEPGQPCVDENGHAVRYLHDHRVWEHDREVELMRSDVIQVLTARDRLRAQLVQSRNRLQESENYLASLGAAVVSRLATPQHGPAGSRCRCGYSLLHGSSLAHHLLEVRPNARILD